MSRRRRIVLAAVIFVIGAAGLWITWALLGAGSRVVAVPQEERGPVLLVPGYGGGTATLENLADALRRDGRRVLVVRMPEDATGGLDEQAEVLAAAVSAQVEQGVPSVDVVGHSAGGVVARLWVAEKGGAGLARRIVTLGSPHHGTDLAGLGSVVSQSCLAACRDLAPGSALLGRLNRGDETPSGPRWVSIWTSDDQVVTPPSSARLAGAVNVRLQNVCKGRHVAHGELPGDAAIQALVVEALAVAPPTNPLRCPVG